MILIHSRCRDVTPLIEHISRIVLQLDCNELFVVITEHLVFLAVGEICSEANDAVSGVVFE